MAAANKKQWALVTGASSGLGIDFARELAAEGYDVVMVARRVEPMQELATDLESRFSIRTRVIGMDLARSGAGVELKEILDKEGIFIDVLINNAGFGVFGYFIDQSIEKTLAMLQLNIMSLTQITHAFAKDMVSRGRGSILLVSSNGGYQATPTYAAYSASKSYVLLFGEALHEELKPKGVTVTVLSPGVTATHFLEVSGHKATSYQRSIMMNSQEVVRIGLAALWKGRASIVSGYKNAILAWSNRLVPRILQRKIAHRLMRND